MKNDTRNWPAFSYVCAFLIGVALFWSFGKNWLDLQSATVFLAGLIGVVISVLLFGVWNVIHNSHQKDD